VLIGNVVSSFHIKIVISRQQSKAINGLKFAKKYGMIFKKIKTF
jgi:hypothetical protein